MSRRIKALVTDDGAIYEIGVNPYPEEPYETMTQIAPAHHHAFSFLRTIKREQDRGPATPVSTTYWDIYYCLGCLHYEERQASQPWTVVQ